MFNFIVVLMQCVLSVAKQLPCTLTDQVVVENMNPTQISQWYNNYDACVLSHSGDKEKCKQFDRPRYCTVTDQFKALPDILYKIPKFLETNEFVSTNRNIEMMIKFNFSKKVLVIVGDSLSREYVRALYCALLKENSVVTIEPSLSKISQSLHNTAFHRYHVTIPYPGGKTFVIPIVYLPIISAFHCKKDISLMDQMLQATVWHSAEDIRDNTAVMLFNIGIHEKNAGMFEKALECVFKWAQSESFGAMKDRQNVFVYRETTAQNFPYTVNGEINLDLLGQWMAGTLPPPVCTSYACQLEAGKQLIRMHSNNPVTDWRKHVEFTAANISNYKYYLNGVLKIIRSGINYIPYKEYSRVFYELHPAAGYKRIMLKSNRSKGAYMGQLVDCTHFAYSPLLYAPVLSAIHDICFGVELFQY